MIVIIFQSFLKSNVKKSRVIVLQVSILKNWGFLGPFFREI